ncbi:MAG TPA: PhoU domain-containing protein [Terriglobales bacterium]|nr:PhoU domain-containing protein [Terriglobales bacterium]
MALPAEVSPPGPDAEHAYLVGLTLHACHLAKGAAAHAADALGSGAATIYAKVDECERELDRLDRDLDQRVSAALAIANEAQRRELLACMKCMTDLERIGDLVASFASAARAVGRRLENRDVQDLIRMASVLEKMLGDAYHTFSSRDLDRAITVLRTDAELDRLRNLLFVRHIDNPEGEPCRESVQVLLMAQALERAGDHVKNVAEEVCHFVSGNTLRHVLRSNDKTEEQMFLDWLKKGHPVRG